MKNVLKFSHQIHFFVFWLCCAYGWLKCVYFHFKLIFVKHFQTFPCMLFVRLDAFTNIFQLWTVNHSNVIKMCVSHTISLCFFSSFLFFVLVVYLLKLYTTFFYLQLLFLCFGFAMCYEMGIKFIVYICD